MPWRRQSGMHAEGRDVRVVDHEPDAGKADDRVSRPGHDVPRQPVAAQLLLERVGRPRRPEAETLDLVDGGDVLDPHRLDDDAARSEPSDSPSASVATPRGARR